jgi:hypothetical protein
MADRGPDREAIRNVGDRSPHGRRDNPGDRVDAGKTSGGGSLGHDPVDDQSRVRNEGRERGRRTHETPDPLPELEP